MKTVLSTIEWVRRWVPVLVITAAAMGLLGFAARWTLKRARPGRRWIAWTFYAFCFLWLAAGAALTSQRLAYRFAPETSQWIIAGALLIAIFSTSVFFNEWLVRHPRFDHGRRILVAAPAAAAGYGVFLERLNIRLREVPIRIKGLPKDLDGVRIAQLSDIHRGPFFGRRHLDHAVALANETRPHLTVVTGDLITRKGDPLDDCLASLGRLRAYSGVWGCMGNHEIYAGGEDYTSEHGWRIGLRFLRNENELLRFGDAWLNLAGVDYQRMHLPYLVGAEEWVRKDALNVLLSHSPDVFPVAVEKGYQLTLAGHTHGGQINVEILNDNVNLARFFTPYVVGRYEKDGASIYVTPGLGTVGLPLRLGAPPEVTLIRLCAV